MWIEASSSELSISRSYYTHDVIYHGTFFIELIASFNCGKKEQQRIVTHLQTSVIIGDPKNRYKIIT